MEVQPKFDAGTPTAPPKKSHGGFFALVVLLLLALAGGIAYELSQRKTMQQTLAASTADTARDTLPTAQVARVRSAPSSATVEIPGQTVALVETPMYARVDGY